MSKTAGKCIFFYLLVGLFEKGGGEAESRGLPLIAIGYFGTFFFSILKTRNIPISFKSERSLTFCSDINFVKNEI
jgi:hypothetical protein